MTTFDTVVLHPAVKFTAVREKDHVDNGHSSLVEKQLYTIAHRFYLPVATQHDDKDPATFMKPIASISLFPSNLYPFMTEKERPTAIASYKKQ